MPIHLLAEIDIYKFSLNTFGFDPIQTRKRTDSLAATAPVPQAAHGTVSIELLDPPMPIFLLTLYQKEQVPRDDELI